MKILVVHEVSYRKKVVYEYQDFAERLAARGHQVCVIDFDEESEERHATGPYSKTGLAEVTLENTPYLDLPVVRYFSGRINYRRILEQKLARREVDVVFLYSVFVNGTNTVRLCRRYGVPVVYRVLDVYHKIRRNLLMMGPLWLGERFIYRNADVVCLTNEKMEGYVTKLAGRRPRGISVLHHGVDTEFFKPMPRDPELAQRYGINDNDRVALFLGTTYAFANLDQLAIRFGALRQSCPTAKVIVVGAGDAFEPLRQKVKELGLEKDYILTGFQPYELVPRFISLSDLTFNSFIINDITRDIIPIKMLQYLACAKPVLCAPLPDVVRLFPESESGMVYCPGEELDRFASTLGKMLADDALLGSLSRRGLDFITRNFSMEAQIDKLERLLVETQGSTARMGTAA